MPTEFDEIGIWSEVKLDIVRKYAHAYSTIMAKQGFHHIYIDGFAGPGVHLSKATGGFVPGSPLNALLIDPPFRKLHFIDADGGRADQLRRMSLGRANVSVHEGDCNSILPSLIDQVEYGKKRRALCVLDPYNIDLDWNVVKRAGQSGTIEIFLNFMVVGINRNVLRRNPDKVSPAARERMNRFWGDDSWRTEAYQTSRGLFDDIEEKIGTNDSLARQYRERLRSVAGFRFVAEPMPMRNSTGAIVYYLYFASPKRTGEKIVSDIFEKYRNR